MKKLYYDENGNAWEKVGRVHEIQTKYIKKRYLMEKNANYYYYTDESGERVNETMPGNTELFLEYVEIKKQKYPLGSIANLYNSIWYGNNAIIKLNNGVILSGCDLDNYYNPLYFAINNGYFQAYRKVR